MRDIHPDVIAALSSGNFKAMFLVRFEFDDATLAFHSGFDTFTFEGVEYVGMGNLGNISSVSENGELNPQKWSATLSGIDTSVVSSVFDADVFNRRAICHLAVLDEQGQFIGEPMRYSKGFVDDRSMNLGATAKIKANVRDQLADWNRPYIERNTDQDQRARYPGDKGMEFVSSVPNKKIIWPANEWFEENA